MHSPASNEKILDCVELCETEVPIQEMGTGDRFPGMQRINPKMILRNVSPSRVDKEW